jgi:hypothetical protein
MKKAVFMFSIVVVALMLPRVASTQDVASNAMLSTAPTGSVTEEPRVTAVYGISADDYLPTVESAKSQLRPKVRRSSSRPSFDLPDAFYFIGGPIFILLFLSILVVFLNGFEEKRKEEMRTAARETMDIE